MTTIRKRTQEGQRLTPLYPTGGLRLGHVVWAYQCLCGNEKTCRKDQVESGHIKSCGCYYRRRKIHEVKSLRGIGQHRSFASEFCAICGKHAPEQMEVDHDHRCCPQDKYCAKCVRGWLCQNCNKALGLFKDDPEVLRKAVIYLEERRHAN